jgi:L-rhamnose mutarotase
MIRVAFKMRLKPGAEEIYKNTHDAISQEMVDLIAETGASNYSIFREGLDLFAYLEAEGELKSFDGSHPVLAKWWKDLEPYMEYNDDGSPTIWPMEEVFHVE